MSNTGIRQQPYSTADGIDIAHNPHSPQVYPTAHLGPLTRPCPRGPISSVEVDYGVPDGFLSAITSQINSNIFVPAVMFGPLNTMRTMPGIAHSPILRSISCIAGIFDIAALLCALVLRARIFYLKRRGREGHFAEDFWALRRLRYGDTALCLHSPVVLIFGVMFLFASELVGLVMTLSTPQYPIHEQTPWSPAESGVFWAAVGACSMYVTGTLCTALCLGRERGNTQRIALPVPVTLSEKV